MGPRSYKQQDSRACDGEGMKGFEISQITYHLVYIKRLGLMASVPL